jgi:hypothetical protein
MTTPTVAALYVQTGGAYYGLPNVDPWDEARDARTYAGPWPVVAHPPCARWCRLAKLVAARGGRQVGDDDGTFAAALEAVRRWGGVLEHPAWSLAWPAHGLQTPPARGWQLCPSGDWVAEVSQRNYGHRAHKLTWLLYRGDAPPPLLDWSKPSPAAAYVSRASRRADGSWSRRPAGVVFLGKRERSATPLPFRDLLLSIARSARARGAA